MNAMRVQLLTFEGCPLADTARIELEAALATLALPAYREIDILDPNTPAALRRWGSPTILIDGNDVAGEPPGDSVGCRVYPGPKGVPDRSQIVARIEALRDARRDREQ